MLFNNNNNNNAPANKKIPKGQLYSELRRILLHMRFRVFTTYVVCTCATPFIQWRHCLNSENTFGIVSVPLIVSYLCTYIGCARLHWMFACVPNLSSREKVDNKSVLSIYDRLPQRTEHNGHTPYYWDSHPPPLPYLSMKETEFLSTKYPQVRKFNWQLNYAHNHKLMLISTNCTSI